MRPPVRSGGCRWRRGRGSRITAADRWTDGHAQSLPPATLKLADRQPHLERGPDMGTRASPRRCKRMLANRAPKLKRGGSTSHLGVLEAFSLPLGNRNPQGERV